MIGPSPAMQEHMRLESAFEQYAVLPGLSWRDRNRKMQEAIDEMYALADDAFNAGQPDAVDLADLFIEFFSRGDMGLGILADIAGAEPPGGVLSMTWEAAQQMQDDALEKAEILFARQQARGYPPSLRF